MGRVLTYTIELAVGFVCTAGGLVVWRHVSRLAGFLLGLAGIVGAVHAIVSLWRTET